MSSNNKKIKIWTSLSICFILLLLCSCFGQSHVKEDTDVVREINFIYEQNIDIKDSAYLIIQSPDSGNKKAKICLVDDLFNIIDEIELNYTGYIQTYLTDNYLYIYGANPLLLINLETGNLYKSNSLKNISDMAFDNESETGIICNDLGFTNDGKYLTELYLIDSEFNIINRKTVEYNLDQLTCGGKEFYVLCRTPNNPDHFDLMKIGDNLDIKLIGLEDEYYQLNNINGDIILYSANKYLNYTKNEEIIINNYLYDYTITIGLKNYCMRSIIDEQGAILVLDNLNNEQESFEYIFRDISKISFRGNVRNETILAVNKYVNKDKISLLNLKTMEMGDEFIEINYKDGFIIGAYILK